LIPQLAPYLTEVLTQLYLSSDWGTNWSNSKDAGGVPLHVAWSVEPDDRLFAVIQAGADLFLKVRDASGWTTLTLLPQELGPGIDDLAVIPRVQGDKVMVAGTSSSGGTTLPLPCSKGITRSACVLAMPAVQALSAVGAGLLARSAGVVRTCPAYGASADLVKDGAVIR
jgi:hypothetical protein